MSKKFATLSDMKKSDDGSGSDSGNEDSEKKDAKRQAFYVGGSEKSGQQVLGPAKNSADDLINNIFRQAQEHGAEQVDKSQSQPSAAASSSSGHFAGAGFRLSDSGSGSKAVSSEGPASMLPKAVVHVRLQMWRNGFVIDDGPLRSYEDPESREFLQSIMQNRLPQELLMKHRGAAIEVDLENRKSDNYKPPPKSVAQAAFQGQGNVLGSPSPVVIGAGTLGAKADAGARSAAPETASVKPNVAIDSAKPVSNVQIRLTDGTRLTAQFNVSHRIADIRNFIVQAHPPSASIPFVLMTSFPKKELTDENQTLDEAGLINAVVVQHSKPN